MTKTHVLEMIDNHKNSLIDPVEMLDWTWLRLIVLNIQDHVWEELVLRAAEDASR